MCAESAGERVVLYPGEIHQCVTEGHHVGAQRLRNRAKQVLELTRELPSIRSVMRHEW